MKEVFARVAASVTLIGVISAPGVFQERPDLHAFFAENIGLSQDQIRDIRNGRPVAKDLPSRIPDEIFVFGAVYVHADPEKYIRFASDIERLRKLPEFLAIGTFSNPPQLSDLKDFTLDGDDVEALRKCKPGDCDVQLPARAMERVRKAVNWSAPDRDQQVNRLLQNAAIQLIVAYQQKGNQVLGEYNDKEHPTVVPEQFKYMLSYAKVLPQYLPGLASYLIHYPGEKPADCTDTFQWAKVKFGLKPTLRITHIVTMRGSGPDEPAAAIAEKQLYSSHYFETALDLTFCFREGQAPGKPGFFLIKAMGSEQKGLTGFKGSIVRRVAVDRSVSALEKSLAVIKTTLESER